MVKDLRVGIIGAGHIAVRHANSWARLPGASIVAIADVRTERAEKITERVRNDRNIPRAVPVEELLEDNSIAAVSICTPTDSHRALTEAAAKAGKHILCEKPMALTVLDCDAMIAAAEVASVTLTIGQVLRFFPEFADAKRLVEQGVVGKPAMVRTRRAGTFPVTEDNWYSDPSRSGGVIFDLLVHDIDWLLWCFGSVQKVYAKGLTESLATKSVDHLDYALVTLRHSNGVISHLEGSWAEPHGFHTTFEIAGDSGLLSHDSRRAAPLTTTIRTRTEGSGGVAVPASPLVPDDDPYYKQIVAFARSITENTQAVVTPMEARRAIEVAAAARESLRTGQAITLSA